MSIAGPRYEDTTPYVPVPLTQEADAAITANPLTEKQVAEPVDIDVPKYEDTQPVIRAQAPTERGIASSFARGATSEFFAGQGPEVIGLAQGAIPGGPDTLHAIENEKTALDESAEQNPIATGAGRVAGFTAGLAGLAVKTGGKVALKYVPRMSQEVFKRYFLRTVVEGGTTLALTGAVRGAAEGAKSAADRGAGVGEFAASTALGSAKGAAEGAVAGAVGGAITAPAVAGASGVLQVGKKVFSKAAVKAVEKIKNVLPDDIQFQIKNVQLLRNVKANPANEFATGEKEIVSAVNKATTGWNQSIVMAKNAIQGGLKRLSNENNTVKTNAAKTMITGLERAKKSIGDNYDAAIAPIMKEAEKTGLQVDLTPVRNQVIDTLLSNGGVDRAGRLMTGGQFAQTFPEKFNYLAGLYEKLGGEVAVVNKDLTSKVVKNFRDAIFLKRDIGMAANFARPADSTTGVIRQIYSTARQAIESADERIIPANQQFSAAKKIFDDLKELIPRKGTQFEAFLNTISGDNKQIAKETFNKFKGFINEDVDLAIAQASQYAKRKEALKAVGSAVKKWLPDIDTIEKVVKLMPEISEKVSAGVNAKAYTDKLYHSLGKVVDKSNIEKLLRNLDAMKTTGGINRVEMFEEAVKSLGLDDVLVKSQAARVAERLYAPLNDAVQHAAQGITTGNPQRTAVSLAIQTGVGYMSKIIDAMYRGADRKINLVVDQAPDVIRRAASTRGARYAVGLWLQTKQGKNKVESILNDINARERFNNEDDGIKQENIKNDVDNLVAESAMKAHLGGAQAVQAQ